MLLLGPKRSVGVSNTDFGVRLMLVNIFIDLFMRLGQVPVTPDHFDVIIFVIWRKSGVKVSLGNIDIWFV